MELGHTHETVPHLTSPPASDKPSAKACSSSSDIARLDHLELDFPMASPRCCSRAGETAAEWRTDVGLTTQFPNNWHRLCLRFGIAAVEILRLVPSCSKYRVNSRIATATNAYGDINGDING